MRTKRLKNRKLRSNKQTIDWSQRYGNIEAYKTLCARTHAATYGKCCVCLKAKSEVIHHSRYLGAKDKPGVNIFPTCSRCHNYICHAIGNWVTTRIDPLWNNHNTVGFEKRLQASYKILQSQGRKPCSKPK